MALLARQDNTPPALAAELDAHKQRYQAGRASVIERGTQRVAQIKHLQKELEAEASAHQAVLEQAHQS